MFEQQFWGAEAMPIMLDEDGRMQKDFSRGLEPYFALSKSCTIVLYFIA
jgi:hypothetical protein